MDLNFIILFSDKSNIRGYLHKLLLLKKQSARVSQFDSPISSEDVRLIRMSTSVGSK